MQWILPVSFYLAFPSDLARELRTTLKESFVSRDGTNDDGRIHPDGHGPREMKKMVYKEKVVEHFL